VAKVGLAAVAAAALAAGFFLFLALRPAEPAPVQPIDIPVEGGDVGNRIEVDPPSGGAGPISPLPPPPARGADDRRSGNENGGNDDVGGDRQEGGSSDDGSEDEGDDDGADD
jgi:hypothetical protein